MHFQIKLKNIMSFVFEHFVTSAKEIMLSLALVCLFISRIMPKLLNRFS